MNKTNNWCPCSHGEETQTAEAWIIDKTLKSPATGPINADYDQNSTVFSSTHQLAVHASISNARAEWSISPTKPGTNPKYRMLRGLLRVGCLRCKQTLNTFLSLVSWHRKGNSHCQPSQPSHQIRGLLVILISKTEVWQGIWTHRSFISEIMIRKRKKTFRIQQVQVGIPALLAGCLMPLPPSTLPLTVYDAAEGPSRTWWGPTDITNGEKSSLHSDNQETITDVTVTLTVFSYT